MPRGNRKKKTPEKERNDPKTRRTLWDAEILGNALKEIENKTFSIRAASRAYGIPKTTLADYISGGVSWAQDGVWGRIPYSVMR